jgi:hypothetical protein
MIVRYMTSSKRERYALGHTVRLSKLPRIGASPALQIQDNLLTAVNFAATIVRLLWEQEGLGYPTGILQSQQILVPQHKPPFEAG